MHQIEVESQSLDSKVMRAHPESKGDYCQFFEFEGTSFMGLQTKVTQLFNFLTIVTQNKAGFTGKKQDRQNFSQIL